MKQLLIGFSSLLCVVACSGTDVPVGAASGGASGSAGAAGSTATNAGSGGAAQDPRTEAASYASTDIACSVNSECCVVFDGCLVTGYLVAASDKDKVRALLDSASMDRCLGCIPPSVEVMCEQGKCVAKTIEDTPGNRSPDDSRQDHCGSLDVTSPTNPVGSEFGCGVPPR